MKSITYKKNQNWGQQFLQVHFFLTVNKLGNIKEYIFKINTAKTIKSITNPLKNNNNNNNK
jgi:hypothetical protein